MTRGIRNNNPLNIRYACNNWLGKVPKDNKKDPTFEEFTTMYYGFRAAILLIQTYIIKYGCNTITKIITRWAPSSDVSCCKECAVRIKAAEHPPLQSTQACIGCDNRNNTAKYIQDVCRLTNMGGNEVLSNQDPRLKDIVRAMSLIESGTDIRGFWPILDMVFEDFKPKSVYQPERKPVAHIYK